MAIAAPGHCLGCSAYAGKLSGSAGNQVATAESAGGGSAGGIGGVRGWRGLILRGRVAGFGNGKAAAGRSIGGMVSGVGGERLESATQGCVWIWSGDGASARWSRNHFAGMVANVCRCSGEVSSLHAEPIGAGRTGSMGVLGKDIGCRGSVGLR